MLGVRQRAALQAGRANSWAAILTAFDNLAMVTSSSLQSALPKSGQAQQRWDIHCRVIDNFGDVGVCWRLAADLADRGLQLRLFVDDARPLAWMAPAGHPGVQVLPWPDDDAEDAAEHSADVVIEAFGCDPPSGCLRAMARRQPQPPVWINLEYLSAEDYVERSHGLPSPQRGGLTKWFFFPGYTPRTGGLLRESGLQARLDTFDRHRWLRQHGVSLHGGERLVSLFCYANAQLPALLQMLAAQPTCLLLTPGPAQAALGLAPAGLRVHSLPWQTQFAYDELLWACDLNFVRGEDSLVRALWAGKPLVWQAYPQHDHAHHAKVQALLDRWQPEADVAALWRWWNGSAAGPTRLPQQALNHLQAWQPRLLAWRQQLAQQAPLADQLLHFARARQVAPAASTSPARI